MRLLFSSVVVFGLVVAGCSTSTSSDGSADTADQDLTQSMEMSSSEDALLVSTVSGATFVIDPAAAAQAAAAALQGDMQPAGCLTTTVTATRATYVFAGCSGPYGLAKITGTLAVTYSVRANEVDATVEASNFQIGSAVLDIDATVKYAQSTSTKSFSVTTNDSGKTATGRSVTIATTYSISANGAGSCISIEGTGSTTAASLSWSSSVSGYSRCANGCPAAGGKASFTAPSGRTITITYDGSNEATYTGSSGATGKLALGCN